MYELKQDVYCEIDLLKVQRKMNFGEQKEMTVYLGKEERMKVRLVIEKLPPKKAAEKRRKLKIYKNNKRRNVSKKRLTLCNINTYITNTNQKQIPAKEIRQYYSLRWQIEILFKAWKSVYHIDKIKKMKLERFECMNYGTLILVIITTHLISYFKNALFKKNKNELSELKLFKTIKQNIPDLKKAVNLSRKKLFGLLDSLEKMVFKTCIKQRKKSRLSPFNIIKLVP